MSLSSRGRLIYEEDDKIYRRNVIEEKIFFYTLMMGLPLFATIVLGTACLLGIESMGKDGLFVLAIGWTILPSAAIIVFAPYVFADKLRIYENGFVPPKLPVSLALRVLRREISGKDVFVKYDEIILVTVSRHPTNDVEGAISTKDGLMYTIEKTFTDQKAINKLVEIIQEKKPEVIKELSG